MKTVHSVVCGLSTAPGRLFLRKKQNKKHITVSFTTAEIQFSSGVSGRRLTDIPKPDQRNSACLDTTEGKRESYRPSSLKCIFYKLLRVSPVL